jgi:hypothetical protein
MLLTYERKRITMLTEEDFKLLTAFRNLTPDQQSAALDFLRVTSCLLSTAPNNFCEIQEFVLTKAQ